MMTNPYEYSVYVWGQMVQVCNHLQFSTLDHVVGKETLVRHECKVAKRIREWGAIVGLQPRLHLDRWPVSRRSYPPRIAHWRWNSNAYYSPHTHQGVTTHLIIRGQLIVRYPNDASPQKETFGPGSRIDVEANRLHEVWMGDEGCTYVIGE